LGDAGIHLIGTIIALVILELRHRARRVRLLTADLDTHYTGPPELEGLSPERKTELANDVSGVPAELPVSLIPGELARLNSQRRAAELESFVPIQGSDWKRGELHAVSI
jgi:hypothetical protein